MSFKIPILLVNRRTKEIYKKYDSMSSMAKEYGVKTGTIAKYVEKKHVFRKDYYILKASDEINIEPLWYEQKLLVNQYDKNGKYISTFNSLYEIYTYLKKNNNSFIGYKRLKNCIDNCKLAGGYMWGLYDDNPECDDIDPYICIKGLTKKINMYNMKGECVKQFKSIRCAYRYTRIQVNTIHLILNGKQEHSKGFTFRYVDDDNIKDLSSINKKEFIDNKWEEISLSNLSTETKIQLYKLLS